VRDTGITVRDAGYGIRDTGYGEAVVVVLHRRCFFSELRVITLITKKYSILKTTTTTDYHILDLPPLAAPQKRPINFFLSTLLYTDQTTEKDAPPPVGASSKPMAI
jgi:hypothetical protein